MTPTTKHLLAAAILFLPAAFALALPSTTHPFTSYACACSRTVTKARWHDDDDDNGTGTNKTVAPSQRLADLCSVGGGCYQARVGRMCVSGQDLGQAGCAVLAVQAAEEAWGEDGSWTVNSVFRCGGLWVVIGY